MNIDFEHVKNWNANWIWYPGAQRAVNFHFFARKTFEIDPPVSDARLHISAYTDYKLFINGEYAGCGPNPSIPKFQYYDTYDVKKHLKAGKNVIAVLAHNYAVGLHWHPMGPGGLIARLDMETDGGAGNLVTDESWKVKQADCYALNSPRMMWPCRFLETFDFSKYDPLWTDAGYDDSGWESPEIIGRPPQYPWENLIPREIPFLNEEIKYSTPLEKGTYKIKGFHAISFDGIIPHGENCIGYAQTYFYNDRERKLVLNISCDDAFKAFLNDKQVLEQGYDEVFVRNAMWNCREEYEQFHYGVGNRSELAEVVLNEGWNSMLVVVDQGPGGWGFGLGFCDLKGGAFNGDNPYINCYEDLVFSDVKDTGKNRWTLSGPFESTGMKNSLNRIESDLSSGVNQVEYDPFIYEKATDYAFLMRAERRTDFTGVTSGKALMLNEGEFYIFDLEKVMPGFPVIDVGCVEETIIDVGYSNILGEYKNLPYWYIRYADRIYLSAGRQRWEALSRRAGRYILLSCRKGKDIKLNEVCMNSIGYPVEEIVRFESSDKLLDKIWEASKYSNRVLMQDNYQDCLRREEGVHNPRDIIHMALSAVHCYGDYKLARKTILDAIRTQDDTGWFCGHGPTDNNIDEPTKSQWWVMLLKDYYLYSGDISLLKELYENLKGYLRYYSRLENMDGLLDGRNEFKNVRGRAIYMDEAIYGYPYLGLCDRVFFGFNILYYQVLKSAAYIARELGFGEDENFYNKKAGFVRESCNKWFWDEEKDLYIEWSDGKGMPSDASQAIQVLALSYDICDENKAQKILKYLCDTVGGTREEFENYRLSVGLYYNFLDILFKYGREEMAVKLMKAYYGRWLELGGTAFPEDFYLHDYKDKKVLDTEFEVHGHSPSAHLHFYSNILGIRPLEPGFKSILFAPHPGDLEWAKGRVHTSQGEVCISWQVVDSIFKMEIEMPEQCRYEIKSPEKFKDVRVKVNGKPIIYVR